MTAYDWEPGEHRSAAGDYDPRDDYDHADCSPPCRVCRVWARQGWRWRE